MFGVRCSLFFVRCTPCVVCCFRVVSWLLFVICRSMCLVCVCCVLLFCVVRCVMCAACSDACFALLVCVLLFLLCVVFGARCLLRVA